MIKGKGEGEVALVQVLKTYRVGGGIAVAGGNGQLQAPAALSP